MKRTGVVIPLFSLRTRAGGGAGTIGDLPAMAAWAAEGDLSILQLLPVMEVAEGESSPYSSRSAFALDPVYLLRGEGEPEGPTVDWGAIRPARAAARRRAFEAGFREDELEAWAAKQGWLDDYTLFATLHRTLGGPWWAWPAPLRDRDPAALDEVRRTHADRIRELRWTQWRLAEAWREARGACAARGVELWGDLPFVVGEDSADVWARQGEFRRDLNVGTPPDAFSAEGQNWGLPVYRWEAMAASGWAWMRARAARMCELVSCYRVDHVVGLYRTYAIAKEGGERRFSPADEGAQRAQGELLLGILGERCELVVEDLGTVPDFVRESLARLGIPGMRVLRWEKDGPRFRDPATWPARSVAMPGTHDTEGLADWYDWLPAEERAELWRVPGLEGLRGKDRYDEEVGAAILAVLLGSGSETVLVPFQDLIGDRGRINVPATVSGANWSWRMARAIEDEPVG